MLKLSLFIFLCISAALAENSFELTPARPLDLSQDANVGFPEGSRTVSRIDTPTTVDNGRENWGDKFWGNREQGDKLEIRGITINPTKNINKIYDLKVSVPGKTITHMRFINIGRERAWVASIKQDNKSEAIIRVFVYKRMQFRLLVEVYSK